MHEAYHRQGVHIKLKSYTVCTVYQFNALSQKAQNPSSSSWTHLKSVGNVIRLQVLRTCPVSSCKDVKCLIWLWLLFHGALQTFCNLENQDFRLLLKSCSIVCPRLNERWICIRLINPFVTDPAANPPKRQKQEENSVMKNRLKSDSALTKFLKVYFFHYLPPTNTYLKQKLCQ